MTKIGVGLGGGAAQTPTPPQSKVARAGSGVDWSLPQYATPHPAPTRRFGRHVAQRATTPQLPERNVRVRAIAPATAYTREGTPIPSDQWVTVPISPSLIEAEERGDVEIDKGKDAEQSHSRRHRPPPPATPE